MKQIMEKAEVLIEALPYIQKFNRRIIVVNGGDAAVTLFDMNGRAVMSGDAAFGLDASALASGVYVLAVKDKAFKVILK